MSEAIPATTSTTATPIRTIRAGGRLRLAVPNSSAILKSVCSDGVELLGPTGVATRWAGGSGGVTGAGGGEGNSSGIVDSFGDSTLSFGRRSPSRQLLQDQSCFIALAKASTGRVFRTSSFVSHARRAWSKP